MHHACPHDRGEVALGGGGGGGGGGEHFYLGNRENISDPPNDPILNTMGILAKVMSATSESEPMTFLPI